MTDPAAASSPPRHHDLLDPLGANGRAEQIVGDDAWLGALVAAEAALSKALVAAGIAPEWMLGVADSFSASGAIDLPSIAVAGRAGGNPVIPLVTQLRALADSGHAGAAQYVHVGATSQDIVDTAAMLVAAHTLESVTADLRLVGSALADLARTHRRTPQAGRTLGQHASPTTFGFVVAGWLSAVCSLIERAVDVRQSVPASLAGAVGTLGAMTQAVAEQSPAHPEQMSATAATPTLTPATGTAEIVDAIVADFAATLGLARPALSWHTNRLPIVEVGSMLAAATGVMGSIASQVAELCRTEIQELGEGLGAGEGGSSAMPHKRNPVGAVLILAAAKQTPGLLSTLYGGLIAEDQRAIGGWHAEWQTLRQLERLTLESVSATVPLIENLHVDSVRMRSNLDLTHGLLYSERVSSVLARQLGRDRAFELVREASAAVSASDPLEAVLDSRLAANGFSADSELRAHIQAAFDPDLIIDHTATGIDRALEHFDALCAGRLAGERADEQEEYLL
ncbi:MAG: 3-carboxy-cis,cis-muconate cycloisomerase [Subtercola sp.]|nr:3-carboxy-cis,cis-muconate cycloisomerase [Subtercola sp.]